MALCFESADFLLLVAFYDTREEVRRVYSQFPPNPPGDPSIVIFLSLSMRLEAFVNLSRINPGKPSPDVRHPRTLN